MNKALSIIEIFIKTLAIVRHFWENERNLLQLECHIVIIHTQS